MSYVLAPRWKGQILPPGARGYPASHPNVFSFARPRYLAGRGFFGLGQTLNPTCDILNTPGCSWTDTLWMSEACQQALSNCTYGAGAPLALTVQPPAAPVLTPGPGVGTPIPGSGTAAGYQAAAAAVAASSLPATQAANAAANACPSGMFAQPNGTCGPCPPGQTQQVDGSCAAPSSVPSWVWYAAAALGALVVIRTI